jgi:hypothetical protein
VAGGTFPPATSSRGWFRVYFRYRPPLLGGDNSTMIPERF